MALVPKVLWAQRKDRLYISIDLQDVQSPKIDITNDVAAKHGKITFAAEGRSHATGLEKHQYTLELDLYQVGCSSACVMIVSASLHGRCILH